MDHWETIENTQCNRQPQLDEPLDFSELPLDLQLYVAEKLTYDEFYRFEEVSRLSQNVCWAERRLIPYDMPTIYVNKNSINMSIGSAFALDNPEVRRIPYHTVSRCPVRIAANTIVFPTRITSGRMRAVAKLFEKNKTAATHIRFYANITFDAEDLDYLLKVTSPSYLKSEEFLPQKFFQFEGLQKIPYLYLESTGCTDDELVKLNGKDFLTLRSDFITSRGLNNFIKQWKRREREIRYSHFEFGSTNQIMNVDQVIAGLDANIVWTPATHNDSILAKLPIEDIITARNGEPGHIYSIWRTDDYDVIMIIRINNDFVVVSEYNNERAYVLNWLTPRQYYVVVNECIYCGTQFCYHRRRFSTVRFKEHFPITYNLLGKGIMGLRVLSAASRFLDYISGERPFTRVPEFGFQDLEREIGISRVISMMQFYLFHHI